MLLTTLSTLALLPLVIGPGDSHGKLTWFEGSFDELRAEAAKTERAIFLDFYTITCAPCRAMDGQTFSDPAVVEAMKSFLCYAVDGDDPTFRSLSESVQVRMFPALVFLDSAGEPVDKIEGFRPPRVFLSEVKRIKRDEGTLTGLHAKLAANPQDVLTLLDLAYKQLSFGFTPKAQQAVQTAIRLVRTDKGFDPQDVEARFAIAKRFRDLGQTAEWSNQIRAIQALDPDGKSRPMRRLAFDDALGQVRSSMNDTDLRQVMIGETDHEMLHLGWHAISTAENYRAQRTKMKGKRDEAGQYRQLRRQAIREAFRYASPTESLTYGIYVAQLYLDELDDLDDKEKPAALEVARKIATDANNDTECLDLFAQWLALTGDRKQALEIAKRCVKLDPTRMRWRGRVAELEEK